MPYTAFQAMIDPFVPRGMLNYHLGIHLTGLVDEAIGSYVDLGAEIAQVSSPTTQAIRADKYAKLVALKDKWDPDNLFRVNQNIKPSRDTRVPVPG
jgi:hypothetical protein